MLITFILPLNKYRHVTKILENLIYITYSFYYNIENSFQLYLKLYITKLSKQVNSGRDKFWHLSVIMYYKQLLNLIIQLKLLTFSLYIHCYWGKCSKCPLHVSQLVFKMEVYFHQKIKVVLMDVIGSKCVWKSRCDWSTHSAASWESYSIFTCELVWKISGLNLVWKISGLNLVWNFSYMKFFIHEIGVNFLSGMFNLVPHVKFLICIHFKHVSGVNQVWNRPDLMRIFCTGVLPYNLAEAGPKPG